MTTSALALQFAFVFSSLARHRAIALCPERRGLPGSDTSGRGRGEAELAGPFPVEPQQYAVFNAISSQAAPLFAAAGLER